MRRSNSKVFPETINLTEKFLGVPAYDNYVYNVNDNSSYVPKSYAIQKILFQENILKKISKTILPSFLIREKIRRFLIKRNTKTKGYDNKNFVSEEASQLLYQTYLKDDYNRFKNRTDYKRAKYDLIKT